MAEARVSASSRDWTSLASSDSHNNVELFDEAKPSVRHTVHLSRVKPYRGAQSHPKASALPEDLRLYVAEDEDTAQVLPLPNSAEPNSIPSDASEIPTHARSGR